jgi:hypothetical protein
MKRMIAAALLAATAALAAPASAATLYVGHGIDGRDLGQAQGLPVDICLVGGPAELPFTYPVELLSGKEFGAFAKIADNLPAGRYDVEVQLAGGGTCNSPVAIASSFFLGFGENATAFAHLTEYGTPVITKFVNDVRPLAAGQARLFARHAAAFGDVNVLLRQGKRSVMIRGLENPDQEGASLGAGSWSVAIYPADSWWKPAFSATLPLASKVASFAYAVGSPAKGTFSVLLQTIDLN